MAKRDRRGRFMALKYELIGEPNEQGLRQIRALKYIPGVVSKGEVGGWVSGEHNLSHRGSCWIYSNAKVFEQARVSDNAQISSYAVVRENAIVSGDARVSDAATIRGNACINKYAVVDGKTVVTGRALITELACVTGGEVYGSAMLGGRVRVSGNCLIGGHTRIDCNTDLFGDAIIDGMQDFIVFKNWWSSGRYFIWTRSNNMWSAGCFYGTGEELIAKAKQDSHKSYIEYKRVVEFVEQIRKGE